MKVCTHCSEPVPEDEPRCPKDGADLQSIEDPNLGKTIGGRYRLISRLGTGGMSSVYLARHVMIDRLAAIKTLRRDLTSDSVHRDRFLREARAANRINHENIVEIIDFGESDEGIVYLVMEYVPGEPLLEALANAPFPPARALGIAEQVGGALARAHQMGVIHRDLKPENILLVQRAERTDFVKILDFGIAKLLDAPSLSGSQQIFGTPGYIAPEYIQSSDIDGRADLYSLGVLLYEMVTGALPFDFDYPGDLLVKHVTETPIAPRERCSDVVPVLEEFLLKALEKKPSARFRDAFHFLEELRAVREQIGATDSLPPGERSSSAAPTGGRAHPQMDSDEATAVDPKAAREQKEELAQGAGRSRSRTLAFDEKPSGLATSGVRSPSSRPARVPTEEYDDEPTIVDDQESVPVDVDIAVGDEDEPTIPAAPVVDDEGPILLDVDIAAGSADSGAAEDGPETRGTKSRDDMGVLGVKRWRVRFDAIRDLVEQIKGAEQVPADVTEAVTFASGTLEQLEEGVSEYEQKQRELEQLDDEARDMRATLGRSIDDLARHLSKAQGELQRVVARRNELRDKREVARAKARSGGGEGAADAVLWELAAMEEQLQKQASYCDALEAELAELRSQFEQDNERFERARTRLIDDASARMTHLEQLARRLREPLARAERFVHGKWPDVQQKQPKATKPTAAG